MADPRQRQPEIRWSGRVGAGGWVPTLASATTAPGGGGRRQGRGEGQFVFKQNRVRVTDKYSVCPLVFPWSLYNRLLLRLRVNRFLGALTRRFESFKVWAMFSSPLLTCLPPALFSRQKINTSLADDSIRSRRKLVPQGKGKRENETSPEDL